MKVLLHFVLAAALALLANSADAASPHRKVAVKTQSITSGHRPARQRDSYSVQNLADRAGNSAPVMQVPGSVVVFPGKSTRIRRILRFAAR
jgi:hypothetical protein